VCQPPEGGYAILSFSGSLNEAEAKSLGEAIDRRGGTGTVVKLVNANSGMEGEAFAAHVMRLLDIRIKAGSKDIGVSVGNAWQPLDLDLPTRRARN
jgi:hypothetical protein